MQLDFLVIGAQKCATSWLYSCLRDHPDLQLPARKREVEYLGGDIERERGVEWYEDLIGEPDGRRRGDVSVEYLADPRAPLRVAQEAPGVKLIVSVRDPVERLVSAYYWYVRKAVLPDLPLAEGVRLAIDAFREEGYVGPNRERYGDLVERGCYARALDRYLEHFPLEQLLVLSYDEVRHDPLDALRRVYAFLHVDDGFVPRSLGSRPKRNTYSRSLISLERLAPRSRLLSKVLDAANRMMSQESGRERPTLPTELRDELVALYGPEVSALNRLIGSLPPDQRPRPVDSHPRWGLHARCAVGRSSAESDPS